VGSGEGALESGDLLGNGGDDLVVGLAGSVGRLLGGSGGLLLGVISNELGESGGVLANIGSGGRHLVSGSLITGGLVSSAGLGVGVVVRDSGGLGSVAAGSSGTVHRAVSASTGLSLAVDGDGTVGTGADGEGAGSGGDVERSPLSEVLGVLVSVTLHLDGLLKILITVHAGGEEHLIAGNTVNVGSLAGRDLNETGSGGELLVPGGLVEVGGSIRHLDGGGRGEEKSDNRLHFF